MQPAATISDNLQDLIGKPAWGLMRTHGSMFFLELGQPIDHGTTSRGRRRTHGEWHFLFESCSWSFSSPTETLVTSSDPVAEIESCFDNLPLGTVQGATFDTGTGRLNLIFASGLFFDAGSDADADLEPDDLEWMLFVPGERVWCKTVTAIAMENIHAAS